MLLQRKWTKLSEMGHSRLIAVIPEPEVTSQCNIILDYVTSDITREILKFESGVGLKFSIIYLRQSLLAADCLFSLWLPTPAGEIPTLRFDVRQPSRSQRCAVFPVTSESNLSERILANAQYRRDVGIVAQRSSMRAPLVDEHAG